MAKITLDSILSGFNLSKINSNFQKIQDELNNKVWYRNNPVGEANTPTSDVDMNGKNLLNVGTLSVTNSLQVNGLDLATEVQAAADSAAASANSATASAASATDSATSLDSFKKQYQGRGAVAPTTRYDGTALQVGDLYFNTTLNSMQVYGNSGWVSAGSSVNGTSRRQTFTYTSGTPSFTITGGYDSGYVDVYLNGYKLIRTSDFDDTSGTAITIQGSLTAGDIVDIVAYGSFSIANVYTKTESDAYRTTIYSRIGDSQSLGYRNRIINGDMRIDQRNSGSAVTINSGANTYTIDRWFATGQATDGVFTVQRGSATLDGFTNSIKVTVTTADGSIGSTQSYAIGQKIEGYNIADFNFGQSNAKTITLSFLVNSSVTGTFSGVVTNELVNRTYAFTFTVNSANTWEVKSVTIPGDTSGTWSTDSTSGMRVYWCLGVGSTYKVAANAWGTSVAFGATGSVDLISTLNAVFQITGVQLEVGTVATPFERVDYGEQLRRCQRYYERLYIDDVAYTTAGNQLGRTVRMIPKRVSNPTVQAYQAFSGSNCTFTSMGALSAIEVTLRCTASSTAAVQATYFAEVIAEL